MNMLCETRGELDIFKLKGEIKVNVIPEISPQLSKYIQTNPDKNLVLDLSEVKFVDSSTIRLLINLHKKLIAENKSLFLVSPSPVVTSMLTDVKLDTVFKFYKNTQELTQESSTRIHESYKNCAVEENGQHKLTCTCAVCGSSDVMGYYVDENDYSWSWDTDDLVPAARSLQTNELLDVFGLEPVICKNCFMCSINMAHFDTSSGSVKSSLSEFTKQHLSKDTKTRKKIMDSCIIAGDDFYDFPRKEITTFFCLKLADSCSHSMIATKVPSAKFMIGYLNYLSLRYAQPSVKEELFGTIRTWLSQVIAEKESYETLELIKSYAILIMITIASNKQKESIKLFEDFSSLINTLPKDNSENILEINNPFFWYNQTSKMFESPVENAEE